MDIVTPSEMREIDRRASEEYGIPSILLMEYAADAVVQEVTHFYAGAQRVLVLCGSGNNGGDGYAVARKLALQGKAVYVLPVGEPKTEDAKANARMFERLEQKKSFAGSKPQELLAEADLVIDAVFGTGSTRPVQGNVAELFELVNQSGKPVASIDHPSGINAENGEILGTAIRADLTVVLGMPKTGTYNLISADYFGKIVVKDIHLPLGLQKGSMHIVLPALPKRSHHGHKGTFGRVFALCGSMGMTGAAVLSSYSALKAGAGVVLLGTPESQRDVAAAHLEEVMVIPLPEENGMLSSGAIGRIMQEAEKSKVILFGCGIGVSDGVKEILKQLITTYRGTIIIDADGITCLAQFPEVLHRKTCEILLTPHVGEFARLCGKSIDEVNQNWLEVAKHFSTEYNVIVVLKSSYTAVADPSGEIGINIIGNDGMGTAGSGDVLAGTLAGLYAQANGMAETGVYLHALAGDIAYETNSFGLTSKDIQNALPLAIKRLTE